MQRILAYSESAAHEIVEEFGVSRTRSQWYRWASIPPGFRDAIPETPRCCHGYVYLGDSSSAWRPTSRTRTYMASFKRTLGFARVGLKRLRLDWCSAGYTSGGRGGLYRQLEAESRT